jgi:hypothetical protein
VTCGGFVEHHVKHAECVVNNGEPIIVDYEQTVLVTVHQNF